MQCRIAPCTAAQDEQIVSRAVASDKFIDIFARTGLKSLDISILSNELLAKGRSLPQKNVALELLRKSINDDLEAQSRKNLGVSRSFAETPEKTIENDHQYQNRSIETAQVITQLIELAKDMREAQRRGEDLGLSDDELAFYDALEVNDSVVTVLGDDALRPIARELVESVRRNVTIDCAWNEGLIDKRQSALHPPFVSRLYHSSCTHFGKNMPVRCSYSM